MPGKQLVGQSRFVFAVFISKKRAVDARYGVSGRLPAGRSPGAFRRTAGLQAVLRPCAASRQWRSPGVRRAAEAGRASGRRFMPTDTEEAGHPVCRCGQHSGGWLLPQVFQRMAIVQGPGRAPGCPAQACPGRGRQAVMNWVAAVRAGAARGLPAAAASERRPPGRGLPRTRRPRRS